MRFFIRLLSINFFRTIGLACVAAAIAYLASIQLFPKMVSLLLSGALASFVILAGTFRFVINFQFLRSLGLNRKQIFFIRAGSNLMHLGFATAIFNLAARASLAYASDQDKASEVYDAVVSGMLDIFRFSTGSFILHFPSDIFFFIVFFCIFVLMAPVSVWASGRQLNSWKNSMLMSGAILITVGCIAIAGLFMWVASFSLLWFFLRSTQETLAIPRNAFRRIQIGTFATLAILVLIHFALVLDATNSKDTKERVSAKLMLYKVGYYSQNDLMLEGISKRNIHRFASYSKIMSDTNQIAVNNPSGLVEAILHAKDSVQLQEASQQYTKNDLTFANLKKIASHTDSINCASNFPLNLSWTRMKLSDADLISALKSDSPSLRLFAIYSAAQNPRELLRVPLLELTQRPLLNWEAYRVADAISILVGKKVSLQELFTSQKKLLNEKIRPVDCEAIRRISPKKLAKAHEPEINLCLRKYLLSLPDHEIAELAGYDWRGWQEYPFNSSIFRLLEIYSGE